MPSTLTFRPPVMKTHGICLNTLKHISEAFTTDIRKICFFSYTDLHCGKTPPREHFTLVNRHYNHILLNVTTSIDTLQQIIVHIFFGTFPVQKYQSGLLKS